MTFRSNYLIRKMSRGIDFHNFGAAKGNALAC